MFRTGTVRLPYDDPMTGMAGTWDLSGGSGPRSYTSPDIPFVPPWGGAGSPFANPPTVVLSVAGIEVTGGLTRFDMRPVNVQAEECNIIVNAYLDCTISWLWVTWLAHDTV